jgi:hypothetical protein
MKGRRRSFIDLAVEVLSPDGRMANILSKVAA